MKIKKLCGAILSAVIAASLFTGCTNGGDTAETTETTTEAVVETASAKVTVDGTKFIVDGKELIINGVNTPWQNWNEFGSDAFQPEFWDSHFADLHAIGVNAVRVWVNCDSMVAIKLKPSGQVREVVEKHWTDIDKLFEIAEKHQIYLMPTLLSFDHCKNGQYTDRWRAVLTDDAAMQSYIDSYVKPFAERYGSNPYLLGIDLMNEPDWVVENAECGKLPKENLSNFFAKCTAAVHETNPDTLVTVGMGMVKYNSDNEKYFGNMVSDEVMKSYAGDNACLDFYSVHYYDWMRSYMGCPFDMSPTDFGLDGTKPSFLGEFGLGANQTYEYAYENTLANGWNGSMMWCSNNGAEHADVWADLEIATKKVESLYPDKVFPLGKN